MMNYYDDDDFEQDKRVFERHQKFAQRLSQEQALKDQANIFADALSQAGLDEKTFNELVQSDPQGVRKDFEQGVREYVSARLPGDAMQREGFYLESHSLSRLSL